ncbi:hypothetical protein BJ170DRAFT_592778 [Xylariales sp. AK1849]|nr:hypothetical protein BJ170DRAFT_592778 [Xylariales sp. AK1849]
MRSESPPSISCRPRATSPWRGNITDGGSIKTFTGSDLQDIQRQIAAARPGFAWKDTWFAKNGAVADRKRSEGEVLCNMDNWQFCDLKWIEKGIDYLRNIPGECRKDARPNADHAKCSRVSCSYSAAIFYCNDNFHQVWTSCASLGDRARSIANECQYQAKSINLPEWRVVGQQFDTDGWNVIVASDDC